LNIRFTTGTTVHHTAPIERCRQVLRHPTYPQHFCFYFWRTPASLCFLRPSAYSTAGPSQWWRCPRGNNGYSKSMGVWWYTNGTYRFSSHFYL